MKNSLTIINYQFENKRQICLLPIIYCLLLLFQANGNAQEPLTLEKAIEKGLKNNQSVQASELDTKMQEQLRGTTYALPKTEVNGMFGQINSHAQDKNLSVSQTFSPFQFGAKRKLLTANSDASRLRLSITKQEVLFNIRQSWNTILYYSKLNAILQKQNTVMDRFVRAATLKFETGETGSLEKVTATARQQELQQQIKQNEAIIKVEKSRMNVFLNSSSDFAVADTSFVALPSISVLDTAGIKQNANVQLALQEVKVAEANSSVEKSTLWPDLSAGYFIQSLTGNQEVNGQTQYYDNSLRFQGFSVGLSLPIFAGSTVSRIKASKTNIEMQQKNADYLQQQLKSQYQQQMEQLITYQSLLDYYKAIALPNADIITKNATKAYLNGDIAYVEYVQGLETALNIRLNHINAINKFNETVINLQFLLNQ